MHYILITTSFILNLRSVSATLNSTTESSTRSGWFFPPNLRGTADILWNCLSTLFICVFVSLHLNVPATSDGRCCIILRKIKWVFIGVLAPELIIWFATEQYFQARRSVDEMQKLNRGQWTITHSFYANMGGFVVYPKNGQGPLALNAQTIKSYVTDGVLELPTISEHEIRDKSKADHLAKAIACLQVASVVMQCIGRLAQRLPTSSLELATLGYVLCTFITYWFWWDKPLDVMIPTTVTLNTDPDPSSLHGELRIDNATEYDEDNTTALPDLLASGAVLVFGGIHCIAWNFSFPSPIERLLWRISSVLSTFSGVMMFILVRVIGHTAPVSFVWELNSLQLLYCIVLCLITLLYVITRTYLIVEIFISFRLAPTDLYQSVDWFAFVPHV